MDARVEFLKQVEDQGLARGQFLGLLHLLIGRRIAKADGSVVSSGMTWREAAALLKKVRWDKNAVHELGIEANSLPMRDRERYWYLTISQVGVDSSEARQAGDALVKELNKAGYEIGPAPGQTG